MSDSRPFPFGVAADSSDEHVDERGPDTLNRLLLHGARYHDRAELFLDWEKGRRTGWGWQGTPDWRADRSAIRTALVLRQRLQVGGGETVALWFPLSREWAYVERGCWSIGAISVPVWPEWDLRRVGEVLADASPQVLFAPDIESLNALKLTGGLPESVRATILMGGPTDPEEESLPFEKLMDYGSVLDTPERASMWRTSAREAEPGDVVAFEYAETGLDRREVDHRVLVRVIESVLRRFPPARGRVRVLADERPEMLSRAILYACWADGLSRAAFATSAEAAGRVAELEPELVVCREGMVTSFLRAIEARRKENRHVASERKRLLGLFGAGGRNGKAAARTGAAADDGGHGGGAGPICFVIADRSEVGPELAARVTGAARFVSRSALDVDAELEVL
ncbi:MAG: AMP-binding protein [Gemmatimonadota bacterium]